MGDDIFEVGLMEGTELFSCNLSTSLIIAKLNIFFYFKADEQPFLFNMLSPVKQTLISLVKYKYIHNLRHVFWYGAHFKQNYTERVEVTNTRLNKIERK